MAIDTLHTEYLGETLTFNQVGYATEWEKPIYTDLTNYGNVCVGLTVKVTSGTIYVRVTVTDSASATATDSDSTASTSWTSWTGSDRLEIDCSGLTAGESVFKLESKGNGILKDVYIYQSS